jgi:hypothetical protein
MKADAEEGLQALFLYKIGIYIYPSRFDTGLLLASTSTQY